MPIQFAPVSAPVDAVDTGVSFYPRASVSADRNQTPVDTERQLY